MSELKSLYVSVRISKDRLDQFFADQPARAAVNENWIAWWESRQMYGPTPLTEIPSYTIAANRELVDIYLGMPKSTSFEDAETPGVWRFGVTFFSENYSELLPGLAWLTSLAAYMAPDEEGVAMVYDYFWGDQTVMAHIVFKDQQALLQTTARTSELDPELLKAAHIEFDKAFKIISAKFSD